MSSASNRRSRTALIAVGALVAALAAAQQADAGSLYACVKKNGSARIFSKKPRCKKGEAKLSWNIQGTPGKNGHNGFNGTNGKEGASGREGKPGANGAVAGYSVSQASPVDITSGQEITILSKTVPAGHYLVSAKVETHATATGKGMVETECDLIDTATPFFDASQWSGPLGEPILGKFVGGSTLPLQGALSTATSSTVILTCETVINTTLGTAVTAENGQLSAVQTTNNS